MINIEATIRWKGYNPTDLSKGSKKKVWANCDDCGKGRWLEYNKQLKNSNLCQSCSLKGYIMPKKTREKIGNKNRGQKRSEEQKKKMCIAMCGKKHPWYGRKHTKESIKKISDTNKGKQLSEEHKKKISEAGMGRITSKKTKDKISKANKGNKHTQKTKDKISAINKGRTRSAEHIQKCREAHLGSKHTKESLEKMSRAQKGRIVSEKTRQKMSAGQLHIPYKEWENYAKDKPYCPKFNESCKESNRTKYNNQCFICGTHSCENLTQNGKHWNLSVHHIDMDKNQGCDGIRWKLVPVCIHCHGMVHTKLWNCRITYLLNDTDN